MAAHVAPGLYFEVVRPPEAPALLRSDIAGFIGPTRRGPVGESTRVEEWRDYERLFGGLDAASATSYAVHSYFENGGQVAYVVRLAAPGVAAAGSAWPSTGGGPPLPGHRRTGGTGAASSEAFRYGTRVETGATANGEAVSGLTITASTPGAWANNAAVRIDYRRQGVLGEAEVDIVTRAAGEPSESLRAVPARIADVPPDQSREVRELARLIEQVNEQSRFIRLSIDPACVGAAPTAVGPNRLSWTVTMSGGVDAAPGLTEYLNAVETICREPAVAVMAFPGLYVDLPFDFNLSAPLIAQPSLAVLRSAVTAAERLHDRMVLVDLPMDAAVEAMPLSTDQIVLSVNSLRSVFEAHELRAVAVYHPPLWVQDPLGGTAAPQRLIPASGPVAGLVSRLDRERGAHHTPANAVLYDALDGLQEFTPDDHGRLNDAGVNVIRCAPGRGLSVWGGRTLDTTPGGRFIAHRRLTHRLVRAIQRVAQPLVFDVNGPELWLALVRGITSVLLEAWRSGALKGALPEEAFRITCDEDTNPPEERELGRVQCVIEFAPAVPMEFITLRAAVGREGELEVFEQ